MDFSQYEYLAMLSDDDNIRMDDSINIKDDDGNVLFELDNRFCEYIYKSKKLKGTDINIFWCPLYQYIQKYPDKLKDIISNLDNDIKLMNDYLDKNLMDIINKYIKILRITNSELEDKSDKDIKSKIKLGLCRYYPWDSNLYENGYFGIPENRKIIFSIGLKSDKFYPFYKLSMFIEDNEQSRQLYVSSCIMFPIDTIINKYKFILYQDQEEDATYYKFG